MNHEDSVNDSVCQMHTSEGDDSSEAARDLEFRETRSALLTKMMQLAPQMSQAEAHHQIIVTAIAMVQIYAMVGRERGV